MSDLKHTPGPWWLVEAFQEYGEGSVQREYSVHANLKSGAEFCGLARIPACEGDEELEANARLIAAAPQLLEALQWFIDDIDGTHTVMVEFDANVERARAAIAAATGDA